MDRIEVLDSHTEGEPTRVIVGGGPDLGPGTAAERLRVFRERYDDLRSAIICEPRGHDAVVGAILGDPVSPDAAAQVIFFNNVGYLNMCVHGTIGVAVTLAELGRIGPGRHVLETPAGDVTIELGDDGEVAVENVLSDRFAADVAVSTARYGRVVGDVAWGGNWFYLVKEPAQEVTARRIEELTDFTWHVRRALTDAGITGRDGAEIDHIEVFGPPERDDADSKNFVLCPGRAYDRSPCGTGTSAKMACLAADGRLDEGRVWRQESIIGSLFRGTVAREGDAVRPTVSGRAFITAEITLRLDERDPFRRGIRA